MSWGGNPEKAASTEDGGTLHPRNSFAEWKQSVRMTAAPWQEWEIDCATDLRSAIRAADLQAQFHNEQNARLEAEAANQAKQDLMAVVSHDLKNPLNAIVLSLELLRSGLEAKQNGPTDRILGSIERVTTRMNRLIEDLLDVARIESGNMTARIRRRRVTTTWATTTMGRTSPDASAFTTPTRPVAKSPRASRRLRTS